MKMIPTNDEDKLRETRSLSQTLTSNLRCHTRDNEKHKDRVELFFRDELPLIFPAPAPNVHSSIYPFLLNGMFCIHSTRGSQIRCSFRTTIPHCINLSNSSTPFL